MDAHRFEHRRDLDDHRLALLIDVRELEARGAHGTVELAQALVVRPLRQQRLTLSNFIADATARSRVSFCSARRDELAVVLLDVRQPIARRHQRAAPRQRRDRDGGDAKGGDDGARGGGGEAHRRVRQRERAARDDPADHDRRGADHEPLSAPRRQVAQRVASDGARLLERRQLDLVREREPRLVAEQLLMIGRGAL